MIIKNSKKRYIPLNKEHIDKINFDYLKTNIDVLKALRVYFFYNDEKVFINYIIKKVYRPIKIKELNIDFNFLKLFEKNNIVLNKKNIVYFKLFDFDIDLFLKYLNADAQHKIEMSNLVKYGVKSVMQDKNIKNKYKKSIKDKYGDEIYYKTDTFKEKRKNSLIKHFGTDNFHLSEDFLKRKDEINDKVKETKRKKYNNENYNNRKKASETCLEKYGVENYSQTPEYKIKTEKTNIEKYGVSHFSRASDHKIKIKESNFDKFGVYSVSQFHILNFENLNEEFVRQNFIKDSRFLMDDFEEYFNIICRNTSLNYKYNFNIIEPNKSNKCKTQQFIFDSINAENKIFNDHHLGKELDIYLPDYNLAIEYDGVMFHSEGKFIHPKFNGPDKNYHLNKTELCLENNIQLFHIFEGEDLDLWLSMINSKLSLNNKIFARKCIIKELKSSKTVTFLNENHLQGFCQAKINVGLFYNFKNSNSSFEENPEDFELVSVMTFSKPRFNKKYEYELIRFCSKRNYTIVGGASKLWKYFVNKYNPNSVITYANRRFSNGEIYKTLGFTFLEKTSPNYFYFKTQDRKLYNRIKFQKKNLKNILEVYDENLSEAENMFNNDYRRIFDCGNLKFEWIKGELDDLKNLI